MRRAVVDASVAVKWFLPEAHSQDALRLLQGEPELLAPDLIRAELGSVLWKKRRRNELQEGEVEAILRHLRHLPLQIYSSELLMEGAWEFAWILGRSFYDSLYLSLAALLECPLVTADLKLYNALQTRSDPPQLIWVEQIP